MVKTPLQGPRVRSLVEELRSHKPPGMAKKINTINTSTYTRDMGSKMISSRDV